MYFAWADLVLPWVYIVLPWVNFVLPWIDFILPWADLVLPSVYIVLPWVCFILPWRFIWLQIYFVVPRVEICFAVTFCFAVALVGHRRNVMHSLFPLFVIIYLHYFYISNLFYVNGFDFPSACYYSIILHAILYFKLYGLSLTSSLYARPWGRKVVPSEILAKKNIYI